MYFLRDGLKEIGRPRLGQFLAGFYCVAAVFGTLGAAAVFQSNQATAILVDTFGGEDGPLGDKLWLIGIGFAVLVALVVIGGIRSIAAWTSKLVPLMTILYFICVVVILAANLNAIPAAFVSMFTGAFTGEGVAGGVVGVAIVGIQRALFSNAGGVGTAATAHSASKTTKPATEGFVAMWEPLVDSVIICTLTSLAIIVSGSYLSSTSDGIALTADAFRTVSDWFPVILTICAVLFAYSTLLSYCYYGQKALGFLSKDSPIAERIFQAVWVVSIAIGASVSFDAMMRLADSAFFLMSVPNIIGVYFLSRVVRMEILRYRKRRALGIIQEIEQEDLQVGMGDHEPSAEQIATAEEGRRRKRDRMREVRSEFRRARSERMVRKSDKAEYKATGHVAEVTEAEVLDPRTPDLDSAEHEPRDQ